MIKIVSKKIKLSSRTAHIFSNEEIKMYAIQNYISDESYLTLNNKQFADELCCSTEIVLHEALNKFNAIEFLGQIYFYNENDAQNMVTNFIIPKMVAKTLRG